MCCTVLFAVCAVCHVLLCVPRVLCVLNVLCVWYVLLCAVCCV